jgi:crotonobetainyl-CoA:carnitine CoA-transferase CaiB-like acyl-CoA transferase
MGSAVTTTVPHQAFLCDDQKYIAVGVVREEQWPRLCRALKLEAVLTACRGSLVKLLRDQFVLVASKESTRKRSCESWG